MFKPLSLFIGLKYTAAKRRNHFISFISLVSMLGVTLGVAVLILVLSVMNGFDQELRQRILGMVPHAVIEGVGPMSNWQELTEQVEEEDGVLAAAPYISIQGMFTRQGVVRGASVQGIDPELEPKVSIITNHMKSGELTDLKEGEYGVILGNLLARSMGLMLGDKVVFVLPEASISAAGVLPRLKRFTVTGIFSVGAELDSTLAYIHIKDAAKMTRMQPDEVEGLRIKTANLFYAPEIARKLKATLPGIWSARDWQRTHGNLFAAIKMEKFMIGLMLMIIVAVAAFNIISTLVMVVTDKQADIAILRTIGATPRMIMGVFIVQGAFIGVLGTFVGGALGVLSALGITPFVEWIENTFGVEFLPADVYFISYFPSKLMMDDVIVICTASLTMSLLATIYPAFRAASIKPAEALRYEA